MDQTENLSVKRKQAMVSEEKNRRKVKRRKLTEVNQQVQQKIVELQGLMEAQEMSGAVDLLQRCLEEPVEDEPATNEVPSASKKSHIETTKEAERMINSNQNSSKAMNQIDHQKAVEKMHRIMSEETIYDNAVNQK